LKAAQECFYGISMLSYPPKSQTKRFAFNDYAAFSLDLDACAAASRIYPAVFRRGFEGPGFHLVVLPGSTSSQELRQFMVTLKQQLSDLYKDQNGEPLAYLSLGRFDQQTTTKMHLDGAPELSFLMLGYEPSKVASHLHIADYSCLAASLGLTPLDFLEQHNPMFTAGHQLLEPNTITLTSWFEDAPRVLLINNSHTTQSHPRHCPGVLHGATINLPDPTANRIINSTMIAPASYVNQDSSAALQIFLSTQSISGSINP
jgi:hypothetical protein